MVHTCLLKWGSVRGGVTVEPMMDPLHTSFVYKRSYLCRSVCSGPEVGQGAAHRSHLPVSPEKRHPHVRRDIGLVRGPESAIRLIYTNGSIVADNTVWRGSDGIYLEGSSFNEIRGNTVLDSGYMGIPVLYGSSLNLLRGNRVERAPHVGIDTK